VNLKKYILPNLPYAFIGLYATKIGEAWRLAYEAALCRAQADWLVGINATRLFSLLYPDVRK